MTIEEAINVINTWIEPMRKTLKGELVHEFLDAVYVLEKQAIKQATSDKYRWHDLRKNPDDLPEGDMDVLAVRDCMGLPRQTPTTYGNGTWFDCLFNEVADDIIAWRKIEPFDEVE